MGFSKNATSHVIRTFCTKNWILTMTKSHVLEMRSNFLQTKKSLRWEKVLSQWLNSLRFLYESAVKIVVLHKYEPKIVEVIQSFGTNSNPKNLIP